VDVVAVGAGFTVSGPVGQIPIYDWLRGERINAEVPPSCADRHGHSGRHCLDEHMPGAAAVVVGPSGPGARGLTGHLRREWTYPEALWAGDEWGAVRAWGPAQLLLRKSAQEQRPTGLVIRRQARLMIFPRRPLWWWAIGLAGTGQWRQRVARRARRHAPRPWARRCFAGLGREDSGIGSLADKPWCAVAGLLLGVGAEHQPRQSFEEDFEVTGCR
jgi:hypothetical protein